MFIHLVQASPDVIFMQHLTRFEPT